jgi:membrane protease YdiL (CAAX protease family)
MNTQSTVVRKERKTLRWNLAQKHPALTFLILTFAWSWLFWLGGIALRGRDDLLLMMVVFIGGFGPAVGGMLTLGLKNGLRPFEMNRKSVITMLVSSAVIFGLMALRYRVGPVAGYESLPGDLTLTAPILLAAVAVSLIGGKVISSAFSSNAGIREQMASILPVRGSLGWLAFSVLFFPVLVLISWGLATLLGMPVEYPGLWGQPILKVLPLALLSFSLTALIRGGNEEPGWRGMMQPALLNKYSPLVAALIVSAFWSLWHLPLFLNGFYGENLLMGMLGGGIYRNFLAIFLAWVYIRSGGNVLALIILHTTFNMAVDFLPTSDLLLLVLWIVISTAVVFKDKMYRKFVETK